MIRDYWFRLATSGCTVVLITLVLNFPAKTAANWLKMYAELPVKWQRVDGTVFNLDFYGLVVTRRSGVVVYLDRVAFRTSRLSLFTGSMSSNFEVSLNDNVLKGTSTLGLRSWEMESLAGNINLEDISHVVPELELLGVSGTAHIQIKQLAGRYKELPYQGDVSITINNLTTSIGNSTRPLGSYHVLFDEISEKTINAKISNISGINQVFINCRMSYMRNNEEIHIAGHAWLSDTADQSLGELLLLMGNFENNRTNINWSGKINS